MPPEEILPSLMRSNMLRMVLTKHIELNKAADQKANILMTAASIVAAVTFASSEGVESIGPLIVLITSILSVVFAIMVILPKPYQSKDDMKSTNFLYFRSFIHLSEDEYVDQFKEAMLDKEGLYEQYMRDIYRYGAVTLQRKYQWLRAGLFVFLLGLTLGSLYFILNFVV